MLWKEDDTTMIHILLAFILLVVVRSEAGSSRRWAAPQVSLPYATYQGLYNETSELNVFLGVRFAQSTEGQNRWREAQPPLDETGKGVQNATQYAPQCPQAAPGGITPAAIYDPLQSVDSEDCLFVNVYSPDMSQSLPVLVWVHGGSWDRECAVSQNFSR